MPKTIKFCILLAVSMTLSSHAEQTIKSYIDNHWPDERYTNHGNGTVTDNATGLMWQRCAIGQSGNDCTGSARSFTWEEALAEAANSNHAGFSDWRLPNIKELHSLVARDRYDPAININAFPNTPSNWHWSTSPSAIDADNAWILDFEYGYGYNRRHYIGDHVRLVRGGQ